MTGNVEGGHGDPEIIPSAFVEEEIGREGLDLQGKSPLLKKIFFLCHRSGFCMVADPAAMPSDNSGGICDVIKMPMGEQKQIDMGFGPGSIRALGGIKKDVSVRGGVQKTIGVEDTSGEDFELIHGKAV